MPRPLALKRGTRRDYRHIVPASSELFNTFRKLQNQTKPSVHTLSTFQMRVLQNHIFPLLMISRLLCVLGKCIFDEVQDSTQVVSSPASQPGPSDKASTEAVKLDVSDKHNFNQTFQNNQNTKFNFISKRTKRSGINLVVQPKPIRIKTWTPIESPILSQLETQRLQKAVDEAIGTVSELLLVSRVQKRLLLNRDISKCCRVIWKNSTMANFNKCGRAHENYQTESCLGVTIPDDHLSGCVFYPHPDKSVSTVIKTDGPGVSDTDFLLYVHAQNTDKCRADSSVLAYSAYCQMDSAGRPVAGVMVICRKQLSKQGFSHEHMMQTVIHELFHVLGFSKELFSKWRYCSPSSKVNKVGCSRGQMTYTDEYGQMRLFSPSVIKALHKHLNSSHPELGAPLENQDADFRGVTSHWEARVLQGSIMTAVLAEPSLVRVDLITLSALQDTGWYAVNFSRAQSLIWGEGAGDLFGSLSTCKKSSFFFCTGSGLGCHYLYFHKGVCQSDEYLEGCRIYKPLSNGDHSSPSVSVSGRCYKHRCTGRNSYQIQVMGSNWLDCPAGTSIRVNGYRGEVFCPDKRLCYYHDVAPPTSMHKLLPSASLSTKPPLRDQFLTHQQLTSEPSMNLNTAHPFSATAGRLEVTVVVVVGVTAVLFFLGFFMAFYRKCCSFRFRVHILVDLPYDLHL